MQKLIDLDKIFSINTIRIVLNIKSSYLNNLNNEDEIYKRSYSSMHMVNKLSKSNSDYLNEAYIRASICELISLEDISNVKINNTKHPLLILLKHLRNMSIHVKSKNVTSNEIKVEHDYFDISKLSIFCINDLSINDFKNVDSFKYIKEKDIPDFEYTINWFNKLNKDSGIQEVIYQALEIYLSYIECNNCTT